MRYFKLSGVTQILIVLDMLDNLPAWEWTLTVNHRTGAGNIKGKYIPAVLTDHPAVSELDVTFDFGKMEVLLNFISDLLMRQESDSPAVAQADGSA